MKDENTCPQCGEPNIHPVELTDGRDFRRCFQCLWSWWTSRVSRSTEGEPT